LRTSLPAPRLDAAQTVRSYKQLANLERVFRILKSVDLELRPIHHRLADRVRAHVLICLLAYYLEWHLRRAWASLLFDDQRRGQAPAASPVAPAQRSASAQAKAQTKPTIFMGGLNGITPRRVTRDAIATNPPLDHARKRALEAPMADRSRSPDPCRHPSYTPTLFLA
jgi:hypothetical protein